MSTNLESQSPLIQPSSIGFAQMAQDIGRKIENAWITLKHKVSLAVGTKIHDSAASQPVTESALQALLGRAKDFKRLTKALVNPWVRPTGPLKDRCKEAVDKFFQNIDLKGLSAPTVTRLQKLLKYSMYNLVWRGGEKALPKTTKEMINIWNNLGVVYASRDMEKVIEELQERTTVVDSIRSFSNDEVFKIALTNISGLADSDPLGLGIQITRFQHDVEDLRRQKSSMSDTRMAAKIKQLAGKVPVELPKELHAALIRLAGEYMKKIPPQIQHEQVFNMQSALQDAAKVALLLAVGTNAPVSFWNVEQAFEALAKPKLLQLVKGGPTCRPSINNKLHETAKAAGLKSQSTSRTLLDAIMGKEAPVAIPIGGGRMKYYEASGVRSLTMRHAIVTGDVEAGSDIPEKRKAALKGMLHDEAISRFVKLHIPERVERTLNVQYNHIPLTEGERNILRRMLEEDYTRDMTEAVAKMTPGNLEMNHEYNEIMEHLLLSYSSEAIKRVPQKYERFMDYLAVHEDTHTSKSFVNMTSGYCVAILHRLAGFLK